MRRLSSNTSGCKPICLLILTLLKKKLFTGVTDLTSKKQLQLNKESIGLTFMGGWNHMIMSSKIEQPKNV